MKNIIKQIIKANILTYTFDVKVQDVLEVQRKTGQQSVVANVAGEVCHSQCIQWHTFRNLAPWNTQCSLQ